MVGGCGIPQFERAKAMTNKSHHAASLNSYSCFSEYEEQVIQFYTDRLIRTNSIPEDRRDDIMQELAITLWESLASYDAKKSNRKTFADRVVWRKAVDLLRKHYSVREKFHRGMLSLNVNIVCDGEEIEAIQVIPDNTPQVSPELRFDVNAIVDSLPTELREMCIALKSMPVCDYCELHNVSRFVARRRIFKLRQIFSEKLFEKKSDNASGKPHIF